MASEELKEVFPFPGKTKSSVWEYFGFYKDENRVLDRSKAICKLCRRGVNYTGNTTNLRGHLIHNHKEICEVGDYSGSRPPSSPHHSQGDEASSPLSPCGDSGRLYSQCRERNGRSMDSPSVLEDVFINDLLPVEILDSSTFRNLLRKWNKAWTLPSSDHMRESLQSKYLKEFRRMYDTIASSESQPYLIVEVWKLENTPMITTSVQLLTEEWNCLNMVLKSFELPKNYSAKDVVPLIKESIEFLYLSDDVVIVSSVDTKVSEAAAMLKLQCVYSLCSSISAALEKGLQLEASQACISKCRDILKLFSQNWKRNASLQDKQKLLNLPEIDLYVDGPRLMAGTENLLQLFQEQKSAIEAAVADPALAKCKTAMLTEDQKSLIPGLIEIISQMKTARKMVKEVKHAALSLVLPVLKKTELTLANCGNSHKTALAVKDAILNTLKQAYSDKYVRQALLLSSLLDPRYKDLKFVSKEDRDEVYDLLLKEASCFVKSAEEPSENNELDIVIKVEVEDDLDLSATSYRVSKSGEADLSNHSVDGGLMNDSSESGIKRRRLNKPKRTASWKDPLNDWLADVVQDTATSEESEKDDGVSYEICRYKAEFQIPASSSPLLWWKDRRETYPILSLLAKKYIFAPVTLNRMNEKKEELFHKQRATLSPSSLETMLFLTSSYHNNG